MFCSICGKKLMEGVEFCQFCGPHINEDIILLKIENVFGISGRGTVVTGKVENDSIKLNDNVIIVGGNYRKRAVVAGMEMFDGKRGKVLEEAIPGNDDVGILLRDIKLSENERKEVYYLAKN